METDPEKCFKELISMCELRLAQLLNNREDSSEIFVNHNTEESFSFSLNLSPGKSIGRKELSEAKAQLTKCNDEDLLGALRDEFTRQLRTHNETQRLLATINAPLPITQTIDRISSISPTESEHHYFVSFDKQRFCHFDGKRIARELILGDHEPKLLLTGRDDSQMCQWNLEEAKIAEELGNEISEKDFNSEWFKRGGFPYVRPTRKFRRFLSSVVKKS